MNMTPLIAFLNRGEIQFLFVTLAAVLVALLVTNLFIRMARRLLPPRTFPSHLLLHTCTVLRILIPLLILQTAIATARIHLPFTQGLVHITSVATIVVITWLGLRAVKAIQHYVEVNNPTNVADNLLARRIQTQTQVLTQSLSVLVLILGTAGILMTFPSVRQFGASLLASAGLAGLVAGFAARPVLGNMIAGIQIAITQPIRLDDVVIIENEWGRIEEITGAYVVVRIWDSRRLVVPLQWIIENPFQNWTRQTSELIGTVFFWLDYSVPLADFRAEAERLCKEVPHLWNGEVFVVQVTDCSEKAMQVRVLASSGDSGRNWDLRCYLRENLLVYLQQHFPEALPRIRAEVTASSPSPTLMPDPVPSHQAGEKRT